ncbi:SGNH hydrolase-type esterase domain-containing protein [Xylogone sp. PMI_703]|nr:SGNH hydrolase-type esterase domain-containing protein [Xylogone sp. PMI_703]
MMEPAKTYPQCVLFGDSIVERSSYLRDGFSFGAALAEHCARRLDVVNRGLSGYTTANALKILQHILPPPSCAKVEYLLILFGANDAALPDTTGQHVPLETYADNLRSIISHPSVVAHNPTILLVTPPPVDERRLEAEDLKKGQPKLTRQLQITEQYARAIRQIASEFSERVYLVDLWTALIDEGFKSGPSPRESGVAAGDTSNPGLGNLLEDGLHLNGAGYKVFYDVVASFIGSAWTNEPPESPSWIFPHWSIAP